MISRISRVRKRDGRLVSFDERKIADAIHKAGCAVGNDERFLAEELAGVVTLFLEKRFAGAVPGIEEIQDLVEQVLIETGHARMAKAYILYREKRARARERVRVHGESGVGPRVGNPSKALVSAWSKARIAQALVREADLDDQVAADVAARVEERVFRAGVGRVDTTVIRSLVEAELFQLGYGDRVGRQALVGLPRYDVDRLLRGDRDAPWRASGPQDLRRTLADAVLAQYALAEVYSEEVVEAHLDGRLHVLDVGAPCEWVGAVCALPPAGDAASWVQAAAQRTAQLGGLVTRELVLGGLVSPTMKWGAEPGAPTAFAAARGLLGHTALRQMDRRGGRLRLVLDLPALPETEPGRHLVDGMVREHWARFRDGDLAALPDLVLRVPAGRIDSAEGRRSLLPALASAAETGRLRVVFEREEGPGVVSGWFRMPGGAPEPGPGLPVGGAVAIHVGGLAGSARTESALLEGLESALDLAIKALRQKRTFLAALQADPAAPLYRVAAGARPLLRGERGVDLVQLVGVARAAARFGDDEVASARLAGRLRAYAAVRVAEEGRRVRLEARLAPDRDGEAARRFDAVTRAHGGGAEPHADQAGPDPLDDTEPFTLPQGVELPAVTPRYEPVSETVELRFAREAAPAPEALFDACCLLARDPRVAAVRLVPWPDRSVRGSVADL